MITVAIHTFDRAIALKALLEKEGIECVIQNVNPEQPSMAAGVRVRIKEQDLPLALRIIENPEIFTTTDKATHGEEGHTIIVPVDFSDYSLNAVKVAFQLAEHHQAQICLLHAYIDPYIAGNMQLSGTALSYDLADAAEARRQLKATANAQMVIFADKVRTLIKSGELPAVKFTHKISEGVPEDAIVEYAKENPPFLVVMGTRGSDRKESEMIGSVTAEVLDKSQFTVLTVPEPLSISVNHEIKNIVFFTNLDQEDMLAFDTMARIFDKTQANVTLAHIPGKRRSLLRNTRDSLDSITGYCKSLYPQFTYTAESIKLERIIDQVQDLEDSIDIDLIVFPHKKQNVFARLFNPGLAHRILIHADIPMLVIPV